MEATRHAVSTLHQLLHFEARKFTIAEIQLKRSLELWISQPGSLELKTVLQKYLGFVNEHVKKVETFLDEEKISSLPIAERIMNAIIDAANEKMNYCTNIETREACLLACIQLINHYKISVYGTAAAFAKELDLERAITMFHEMEINEKHIDDRLSQLASYQINKNAMAQNIHEHMSY